MSVAILGKSGMLASMMQQVFPEAMVFGRPDFDADKLIQEDGLLNQWGQTINCIGLIKPYCNDIPAAIRVNALFPHHLPAGTIQIATDCVYSGRIGNYLETSPHDALDVYGKTKSLGEAPHLINLRCSIIGPEMKNHLSLLDWFLAQKGEVNGFTNHLWNGVTTYHFALIVKGILRSGIEMPNLQHIVPADVVTKAELLKIIAEEYDHKIKVNEIEAPDEVNRTLATNNPILNRKLWQFAGYSKPPTIRQMIRELAALK